MAEKLFDGTRAAVTGAGGFIGGAVTRRLVAEGAEVTGLDLDPALAAPVEASGAVFARADVTDREALDQGLAGSELVVHTAAYVRDWGTMEEFVAVNVRGTANVLDAAEAVGAERVVHISSVVVYGYDDPAEQEEDAFRRTYGIPYIDTKSASDRLACRRGAIVIRPGDVYGPGSRPWILRPLELAKAGQLAVPGEGLMLPLYADDLVEAILLAARRGTPGRAYTVWDGEPVTFESYFNRIATLAGGRRARRLPRPALVALGGILELAARARQQPPPFTAKAPTFIDRRGTVSIERIRSELDWEPKVSLDEGLRRTEEWLRAEALL